MYKRQSFLHCAIILSIAMLIVKAIGALFKVPLAHIISENGMGYFNTAYNFYAVFFSLATAGFPVAISKLTSQNLSLGKYKTVRSIKKVSFPIFFITGLAGTLLMLSTARIYTNFIGNKGAFLPILALSPTLLFCCLNSIYRGYFEGLRNMYPTAISQVLEAMSKLIIGLGMAIFTVHFLENEYSVHGTVLGEKLSLEQSTLTIFSYSAATAILGVSIGSFLSFCFLILYHKIKGDGIDALKYQKSEKSIPAKTIRNNLLKISLPIAIGAFATSISALIDQTFLQKTLSVLIQKNPEFIIEFYKGQIPTTNLTDISTIPNFLFGCHAYAMTIFMLVPAFTQSLGTSALPNLSAIWVRGNLKAFEKKTQNILKITAIVAFPLGIGITCISSLIVTVLYGDSISMPIISKILAVLGITGSFCALTIPLTSVLQAIGKEKVPVKILILGIIAKLILNYILCTCPQINLLGASISSFISHLFILIAELFALKKYAKIKLNCKKVLLKPLLCAIICTVTAKISINFLQNYIGNSIIICLFCVILSATIYFIFLFLTKTLNLNDIFLLINRKNAKKTCNFYKYKV